MAKMTGEIRVLCEPELRERLARVLRSGSVAVQGTTLSQAVREALTKWIIEKEYELQQERFVPPRPKAPPGFKAPLTRSERRKVRGPVPMNRQ